MASVGVHDWSTAALAIRRPTLSRNKIGRLVLTMSPRENSENVETKCTFFPQRLIRLVSPSPGEARVHLLRLGTSLTQRHCCLPMNVCKYLPG